MDDARPTEVEVKDASYILARSHFGISQNALLIHKPDAYHSSTLMPQPVTNDVIPMPEPSDKKSAEIVPISAAGHRSTQRASGAESPATIEKVEAPAPARAAEPSTEVFAVFGVEPEIQAYAMAKYSRSSLSMKESLREISSQKAEKFLNTFYFQYGHRSIADLAHIALAVERLSILAAIELADEQRWDGQERSTRYQDFRKSGYYTPDFGSRRRGANALSRDSRQSVRRIRRAFGAHDAVSDQHHSQARET